MSISVPVSPATCLRRLTGRFCNHNHITLSFLPRADQIDSVEFRTYFSYDFYFNMSSLELSGITLPYLHILNIMFVQFAEVDDNECQLVRLLHVFINTLRPVYWDSIFIILCNYLHCVEAD